MIWHRRPRFIVFRMVAGAMLLLAPAQPAAAQEFNPPQEQTVAELRQNLEVFMAFDQQRQMFGFPPNPNVALRQIELLEADFDENIMPGLEFAENDCFMAEVPVKAALDWSRQVQLLGFGDDFGPLWEEAAVVQESVLKILKNCHKEMYEACLLDDDDPAAAQLPGVSRQLGFLDDDPIYEEKNRRCNVGWHGTLKITETLSGNMSQTQTAANSSVTTRIVLSGNRNFSIELLNKLAGATGVADGRGSESIVQIAAAGKCTITMQTDHLRTAQGNGLATLKKHSSRTGELLLSFLGPSETGTSKMTASSTANDPKCSMDSRMPDTSSPTPPMGWPGLITDTLGDPFTELVSGSKTLVWTVNASGQPVRARDSSDAGGAARIPAIPGMPALPPGATAEPIFPWLGVSQPMQDMQGEPPVIRMEVHWDLVFGDAS